MCNFVRPTGKGFQSQVTEGHHKGVGIQRTIAVDPNVALVGDNLQDIKRSVRFLHRVITVQGQTRLRVPVSRVIREDLHSMQRVTSNNGGVTYRAPHTEDGHADRCTALALCVRAAAGESTPATFETMSGKHLTKSGRGRQCEL